MRNYTFKCWECSNEFSLSDTEYLSSAKCPKCGCGCSWISITYGNRHRGRQAEPSGYYSNTMGVHPDQVAEERKLHPNWKFHDDGRLWVDNLQDQRKKVKALGMVNRDDNIG